jgi:phenylacetate-CoA ligase
VTSPRVWRALKWSILARRDRYPDFRLDRLLQRQERMSPGDIAALRRTKTRRLVETCLRHVPYYAGILKEAGIVAGRLEGPEDLEGLPLLTREIIRREKEHMLNRSLPPAAYYEHETGGSSGTPLQFYRGSDYDLLAVAASNMRAWRRMGWRPGDRMVRLWLMSHGADGPGAGHGWHAKVRQWLSPPEIVLDPLDSSPASVTAWIERIRGFGPCFLYGYGSLLSLLGRELERRGERLQEVRGIASTAEALFPAERAALRNTCPAAVIIDIYGSREVPGVAAECPRGTMHINTDLVHVEYLPDDTLPTRHRLVLTALDNLAFPFIRYDIRDEGAPLLSGCPCGLPFPTMAWGHGRVVDFFVTADGRALYVGGIEDQMFGILGVHRYQFLQETTSRMVLSVVPTQGFDAGTRAHLHRVRNYVESLFGPKARLEIRLVREIPPTRSGKHLYFVSRVRLAAFGRNQTEAVT